MANIDILMPALSPTMEEGALVRWLVAKGDRVTAGAVIAEIETDKATMEIEAVDEGILLDILVPEGSEGVKVNTPIARLSGEGGDAPKAPAAPAPAPPSGDVGSKAIIADAASQTEPQAGSVATPVVVDSGAPQTASPTPIRASPAAAERATPLARRIAEQRGLDLSSLRGSGPGGLVVKADVAPEAPGRRFEPTAPMLAPPLAPAKASNALERQGVLPGAYALNPLGAEWQTATQRMSENFRDIPHFPLTIDIELEGLLAVRERINERLERDGVTVSVNDMIIKAIAAALRRIPAANASYTPDGIARHHDANIAVAIAGPDGTVTPVIRKAGSKGLSEIAEEMKDFEARARSRELRAEECLGGTFSLMNLGPFGVGAFSAVLNGVHACALSVGVAEQRAVVRDDTIRAAEMMTVTLTCDHRAVDGVIGAAFLGALRTALEEPLAMII